MKQQIPVVRIMQEVLKETSDAILPTLQEYTPGIQAINYMYGEWEELTQQLQNMARDQAQWGKKYPAVLLIMDLLERFGKGYQGEVSLRLLIVNSTELSYTTPTRYDRNFIPILYPIWVELMNQLQLSPYFIVPDVEDLEYEKIDRVSIGKVLLAKPQANGFSDCLDAIEIRSLKLTVDVPRCTFLLNP